MAIFNLPPPRPRNASAVAIDVIRQAITDGRLEPGQRLKEHDLAREFGISRTPVREALLVLQAEGLIETSPNRGASVRSYNVEELDDMYRLRALLEGYAAQRAAASVTADQLQVLLESCDRFERMRHQDGIEQLIKENAVFHQTVLEAAGSERLNGMVGQVVHLPLQYKSWVTYSPEQLQISAHYHRQIACAIQAREPERAEGLMKEHIFENRDVLIHHLRDRDASAEPQ